MSDSILNRDELDGSYEPTNSGLQRDLAAPVSEDKGAPGDTAVFNRVRDASGVGDYNTQVQSDHRSLMGPSVGDIPRAHGSSIGPSSGPSRQRSPYEQRDNNYGSMNYPLAGSYDKPLRSKSRSRSPTDRIVDIQTEDRQYTEIFSWGADYQG